MASGAKDSARLIRWGDGGDCAPTVEQRLAAKGQRLLDRIRQRDNHFRRSVMADGPMGIMLSLFLADLRGVPLTQATLVLVSPMDGEGALGAVEALVHAGLIDRTGDNPARRIVTLTPLGSARMRSFISDYPDI